MTLSTNRGTKIAVALAIYLVLTVVLDGLIHWWATVATPLPDAVGIGLWLGFTVAYAWIVWRLLRKRI